MIGYKVVQKKPDGIYFIFHGIGGSRKIPLHEWIYADKKLVSDGSLSNPKKYRPYQSGIHVMLDQEEALEYIKRFKDIPDRDIVVIQCHVMNARPKAHSRSGVYLADAILVDNF